MRQPWVKTINMRQPSKKQGVVLGLKTINERQSGKKQEASSETRTKPWTKKIN